MTDEKVDHPKHYNTGKIEVIDAIEDWELGFHEGNVVKYVARAKHKGNELEDLRKAAWYLNRAIEKLQLAAMSDDRVHLAPRVSQFGRTRCGADPGVGGVTEAVDRATCVDCLFSNEAKPMPVRTIHIGNCDSDPFCGFVGACDVSRDPMAATCIECKRVYDEEQSILRTARGLDRGKFQK